MDLAIIPECYVDTNLAETLVPPISKGYNHQKGCGTVTKVMKENFRDRFAVGIIDKDKRDVDYLKEFDVIIASSSLLLHKHPNRHHYIIQISPAIETMILKNAGEMDVTVGDFDLPTNMDDFKKESKRENSKKDDRFKRLFKALKKVGAPDFVKLESWIRYLKEKQYDADMDELKAL
ncbi:hypothetical protein [Foetidibacter luteolus]|uniref:hypothetical protein n=1 Tax=Foetidibacter luteolus TaxID=2608880 RepID=UPI001A99E4B8|nr:hypothetical protein [Foetidibacter luteolus]